MLCAAISANAVAQPDRGYLAIPGAYIWGYGIGAVEKGHNAASCARKCDATPGCLSFEIAASWCSLNKADRRTKPDILTRTARYTYYEKRQGGQPPPPPVDSLYIHRNCRAPTGCIIGIADAGYALPSTARYREGWRRLEGPFSNHPDAWRRACQIHYSGGARSPDIIAGRIDCASLDTPVASPEPGTDRPGSDYRSFSQSRADAGACASACERDRRCRSWTWVRPGVQGRQSTCWLKNRVPAPRRSDCCISGVK